jgi:putative transposase
MPLLSFSFLFIIFSLSRCVFLMDKRFRHKYRIETTRLKGYDYSEPGIYFITICTKDREPFFGEIINKKIKLSAIGKIVSDCWFDLPNHYPNIILDEFIIMPNHVHGIIIITNRREIKINHGIPEFIRAFKSFSSRRINKLNIINVETGLRPVSTTHSRKTSGVWQLRYYDHIIRSKRELNMIRSYIKNNPVKFHDDNNEI